MAQKSDISVMDMILRKVILAAIVINIGMSFAMCLKLDEAFMLILKLPHFNIGKLKCYNLYSCKLCRNY